MAEFSHGHALIVGVGGNLPMTVKDAEDLYDALTNPELCAYPRSQVELFTGEAASRGAMLTALDRLAKRVAKDPEATVIVSFSGHGMGGSTSRLMTSGYDLNRLDETTISSTEFTEKLRAIDSQKLLVLLECCHASGQADAEKGAWTKAPIPIAAVEELTRGSGRVVLASSRADEYSYAHTDNSYFTEAVLEALSGCDVAELDGFTRILDLALYVGRVVPNRKRDYQHPVLKVWNLSDNFAVSYYAGGEVQAKGQRPVRDTLPAGVEGTPSELVGLQMGRLKDREAELEEVRMRLNEYRQPEEAPRSLLREEKRLANEVLELRGKLGTLPGQSLYNRIVTALWSGLGLLIVYYCYNMFALTQNWPPLFWSSLERWREVDSVVSLFAMFWSIPALAAFFMLTHFYQDLDKREDFYTRLPVAFNLPLFSDTRLRRRYQTFFFLLFFVLPMALQVHFFVKMLEGRVYERKKTEVVIQGAKEHLFPPQPLPRSVVGDNYRLEQEETNGGVTFFPVVLPWFLLCLELALFYSFVRLVRHMLRRPET